MQSGTRFSKACVRARVREGAQIPPEIKPKEAAPAKGRQQLYKYEVAPSAPTSWQSVGLVTLENALLSLVN